jgi:hypothetical protein
LNEKALFQKGGEPGRQLDSSFDRFTPDLTILKLRKHLPNAPQLV